MSDVTQSTKRDWHSQSEEDAILALQSGRTSGLSDAEVQRRRTLYGENRLTVRSGRGPFVRFLLQFHQPLIYVLLFAAAVTAWLKEPATQASFWVLSS